MTDSILISEIFYSIEGEGPYTGFPTVFVRMFGCNFTCAGFGKGQPAPNINIKTLDEFKVGSGCDSAYSWHPDFKHLSTRMTVDEVYRKIADLTEHVKDKSNIILCLTGGEPMAHQAFIADLFRDMRIYEFAMVLVETNGSLSLKPVLMDIMTEAPDMTLVWSVSPKLSNSGEDPRRAIVPSVVSDMATFGSVYLKYVSDGSDSSFQEITDTYNLYRERADRDFPLYVMPEGADNTLLAQTNRLVAEKCMIYGYAFCARVHCIIWDNKVGT